MDDEKVAEEFDRRATSQPNVHGVLDAHESAPVRRSNLLRDYVSRAAVLRVVRPADTDVLLDVGCGVGRLTVPLARRVKQVIGVDASKRMIETANACLPPELSHRVEYVHLSSPAIPIPDDSVDKALTCWVLAHMSDDHLAQLIADVRRCLRKGGQFLAIEQVRSEAREFGQIHLQRRPEDYKALFERQGYRWLRSTTVMRSPSYALSLWNRLHSLPRATLPLLSWIEQLTAERKPEMADYFTVAFAFERR